MKAKMRLQEINQDRGSGLVTATYTVFGPSDLWTRMPHEVEVELRQTRHEVLSKLFQEAGAAFPEAGSAFPAAMARRALEALKLEDGLI